MHRHERRVVLCYSGEITKAATEKAAGAEVRLCGKARSGSGVRAYAMRSSKPSLLA
jgi:hypothetical protein